MLSLSFRIFLSKPIRFPKLDGVRSSCQFSSSVIVTLKVVREKARLIGNFLFCSVSGPVAFWIASFKEE